VAFHWLSRRLRSRRAWAVLALAGLAAGLGGPQLWAWYQLRKAEAELSRYDPAAARDSLGACLRVWPGRPGVRLLACRAARQAGDYDEADRQLRACQRLSGGSSDDIAFEWALLQADNGNVREVDEYLQRQAEQNRGRAPLVWEALAVGYMRLYRILDAMSCVQHWLERDPDNVRALELRGMTFVIGKGIQRGAEDFRRVMELDPTRQTTRGRLAQCLLDIGAYEEAVPHLEQLARERPGDPDVLVRLARCYNMTARGEPARSALDAALAGHPTHALALRTRGQFALADQKPAEAEQWLRRAIEAWPNDYQSQWLLLQALQQQDKAAAAREQLKVAEAVRDRTERIGELQSRKLAEQPLDPALHYEMGVLLQRNGQTDQALQWFASALKLDGKYRPAHAALAEYYASHGDPARAAEHRKRAAP
jgi:tetratricopeptide (TPR) repeat protein